MYTQGFGLFKFQYIKSRPPFHVIWVSRRGNCHLIAPVVDIIPYTVEYHFHLRLKSRKYNKNNKHPANLFSHVDYVWSGG